MQLPEKYLTPCEISRLLSEQYGLNVSTDYVRKVRATAISRGEKLFVCGEARVSDVYAWLQVNPTFRAWPFKERLRRDLS